MVDGFRAIAAGRARLLVRDGYEEVVPRLVEAWNGRAEEWIGGGRAPHPVVPLPDGGKAVVRRFQRGGMIRHLNRDRYFGGDRAGDELRATEAARAGGVRVPEVVAAGRIAAFPGYRAMLATRLIPGVEDLASLFARAPGRRLAALREAGRQIGWMHAAGVAHPDLNLRNLLAGPDGEVWVIDFDRARVVEGAFPLEQRARALVRLSRSATKLGSPLGDDDWTALRDGYAEGAPDFG